jgi:hypothetical protein
MTAVTNGDGPPPLAPLAPAAAPITAVPIPAAANGEEEEDDLEALIPQAPAPAAVGGEEDDELLAAYRDLQSSQGQQGGEEDEPPPEALDALALMARCKGRLRRIEAALGEYEVGWGVCVDGWGCWIRGWLLAAVVACICPAHTCGHAPPTSQYTGQGTTHAPQHHHRRHRARGWRRSGRGWRTRTQSRSPSTWVYACVYI